MKPSKRIVRYPFLIRSRLTGETGEALQLAADERGVEIGSLVRRLIEAGVGRLDDLSPVRRVRAPLQHPEAFAAAVTHLGSVSGNLQRLYTVLREDHQIDDDSLLAVKAELQAVAKAIRDSIGTFDRS